MQSSCLLLMLATCPLALTFTTPRSPATRSLLRMSLEFDALLFDCDGVIAETERDAHRISFNKAFKYEALYTGAIT